MDDESRRLEVLQAEEAVRLLAQELARATRSATEFEDVAGKLSVAQGVCEQATQSLERAVEALRQTTEAAQSALGEARAQLERVEGQFGQVAGSLLEAIHHLDEFIPTIGKMVQQAETSSTTRLGALARWVWVSLLFSALAFGSALACLVLLWRRS